MSQGIPPAVAARLTPNQIAALERGKGGGGGGGRGNRQQRRFGGKSSDTRGEYKEVRERVIEFYTKFPEGRLESEIVQQPAGVDGGFGSRIEAFVELVKPTFHYEGGERVPQGEKKVTRMIGMLVVRALAYRTPDDAHPGIGHSMLLLPGETPYTEGSELENCETSAWGRAIAAVGIGITESIASAQEIRNKHQEDVDDEIAAAEAFEAAQATAAQDAAEGATTQNESPVAAPAESVQPVETAPEPVPDAAAAVAAILEEDGEAATIADADGVITGLTTPEFLARVREKFVSSALVSATARELFGPTTESVRTLSDEQRWSLWSALESVLSMSSSPSETEGA